MNGISDKTIAVFPSMYLPSVGWMELMATQNRVVVNDEERFRKSTDRNRCVIAGANGKILLTIPLIGGRGVKSKAKNVRINYAEPWQQHHWRSIQSAYGKSSFFHFYEDRFRPFYEKQFEFLIDYNAQLLQACFDILHWDTRIVLSSKSEVTSLKPQQTTINSKLKTNGLKPYHQVFEERQGFIPNLSIVDLIFNMGPQASLFII